ncbi:tetratricopeptide repeat protein [Solimonas variicoloris]|uniref:tetratricopeptide repeat protein n=1 Tax=Solimonas variicoloris TaxID=254408 RepID=UPI00036C492B|nr:tetratricopeptide repeat protein [Solimonas variicoloris]
MKRCPDATAGLAALLTGALLAACASQSPVPTPTRARALPPSAATAPADPDKADPQQRFAAALQLMREGRRDEAITVLQVLTSDFPQYSGPWTDLGILYAQLRRPREAGDAFDRAVRANPDNAVAWNARGVLYREGGDAARAEQCYRRALAAQPDYAKAHYNLAILYDLTLRRPQDALAHYRQYQQLAGDAAQPMVAVWIRELESRTVAAAGGTPAGAQK